VHDYVVEDVAPAAGLVGKLPSQPDAAVWQALTAGSASRL